jgi:hypothetical protein
VRRLVAGLVLLALLALALPVALTSIRPASAASLAVNAASMAVPTTSARCAPGPVALRPGTVTSGSATTVVVSIPSGCHGAAGLLRLTGASGALATVDTAFALPASGAEHTVTVPAYVASAVTGAALTLNTWGTAVAWSYTPATPPIWCAPTSGSTPCSAAITQRTTPAGVLYYDVVVTTTSTSSVRWEVTFDFSHPFYGGGPVRLGNSDLDAYWDGARTWDGTTWVNDATRSSSCTELPLLSVRGLSNGGGGNNFRDVSASRERRFSLVVDQTQAGYSDVLAPGC